MSRPAARLLLGTLFAIAFVTSCERKEPARNNKVTDNQARSPNAPVWTNPSPGDPSLRTLDQLQVNGELRLEQVEELWGAPDVVAGSGLEILMWTLADGRTVYFYFGGSAPESKLQWATLDGPNEQDFTVLFEYPDE